MKEKIPDKLRTEVAELVLAQWWVQILLATEEDHLGLIVSKLFVTGGQPTRDKVIRLHLIDGLQQVGIQHRK